LRIADCGLHGILNVELLATFYVVKIGKRGGFYFAILYSQFTILCGLRIEEEAVTSWVSF